MSSNMETENRDSSVPPAHTPRPQGFSWREFAERTVIAFLALWITVYIKDVVFKSDNFYLQWALFASLQTLFNLLYGGSNPVKYIH